jgi:chaperonin GroEL
MLQDIAILTGGQVITEETGMKLESVDINMLGRARKISATKENTTIVEGKGSKEDITKRIAQIKREIEMSTSDFDREKLQERMAKLSGGVGVIKVGAATEVEMKQKQQKIEDALAATKAAIEEGIVPGGGVALIRALKSLEDAKISGEEKIGLNILKRALEEPLRIIASNAGKDGAVVVEEIKKHPEISYGYNAAEDRYEDLVLVGIIDPTKVTRFALQNAVSAAALLLTTEAAITDLPEKDDKKSGMPPMGGMEY